MKDCVKYYELISTATDFELLDEQKNELDTHLNACPDCRSLFESFENLSQEIKSSKQPVPDLLAPGIMYKIGLESSRKRRPFGSFGTYTAAAVVIIAVLASAKFFFPAQKTAETSDRNLGALVVAEEYAGNSSADIALSGAGLFTDENGEAEADVQYAYELNTKKAMGIQQFAIRSDMYIGLTNRLIAQNSYDDYYAVGVIIGEIPEELKICEIVSNTDLELHFLAPSHTIDVLNDNKRFSEIVFDNSQSEYGIIVVITER